MLDICIKNGMLVTLDSERRILQGNISIQNGRIVGIGDALPEAAKVIDAKGCVVIPGLVNCHTHLYQALIEGIGYDMHFEPWNWRFLFPIVSRMSSQHSYRSTRLAALEMIKTGTTTVCDHWYMHTDFKNIREASRALNEAGLRGKMVYGLLDESFAGESLSEDQMTMLHSRKELLEDFHKYHNEWHNKGTLTAAIGAGSTQDASEELLIESKQVADRLGIPMCTHVAGWQDILASSYSKYGMRDVEFTRSRGLTGKNSIFIHTVWLNPGEINDLAETKTGVVHCPAANSQLGYGIAPVAEMLQAGVKVGLGTDGAGSYTYDMFEMMRLAAYLQKQKHHSADFFTAEQALELATIKGAEVLGMQDEIGSIEVGKRADITIIDFTQPHLILKNRVVPKIVYSAKGSDVRDVVIDGKIVMEQKVVTTMNEPEELKLASDAMDELLETAGPETDRLLNASWNSKRPVWMEK